MKGLNLYAGIGGNRKLWTDCEVTAVEHNADIAAIYQDFFPKDKVIVGDAHQYLLDHYKEFDFIWASPPCPTHSNIRRFGVHRGQCEALYPDMALYQEIILLQNFAPKKCKWVIENVIPYYTPLVAPSKKLARHYFWTNFPIRDTKTQKEKPICDQTGTNGRFGFNLKGRSINHDKRQILRNLVDPQLGLHIFNAAKGIITQSEFETPDLF